MAVDKELWLRCREICEGVDRPEKLPRLLGEILEGPVCKVMLVDGDKVLVEHDMDFHDANNYLEEPSFIPKGEIWLDDRLLEKEWAFNLYHEAHEVRDMRGGMSYEGAHKRANAGEKALRKKALGL